MWKNYDSAGFSIWHSHYQKLKGENNTEIKATNFRDGLVQSIDKFRKYFMAVIGIYGKEPNFEIIGIWVH